MKKALAMIKSMWDKKGFRIATIVVAVLFVCAVCVMTIAPLKYAVRDFLGLPRSVFYINNVPHTSARVVDYLTDDVREVQINRERTYLINHSRGFAIGFPADAEYDFSTAQEYISVKCDAFSAVISKEWTSYPAGVEESKKYVKEVLHKYLLDEKYIEENNITIHKNDFEDIAGYPMQILALSRKPTKGSSEKENTYAYGYIYKDDVILYRVMFRTKEYTDEFMKEVYNTLESFSENVVTKGVSDTFTEFYPVENENWNDETRALYRELKDGTTCKWGIFTPWAVINNDFTNIRSLEEKAGVKFEGVLEYIYHTEKVPVEGMKTAYEEGKIIELTLQTSTIMNEDLDGKNPMFDVLDGVCDDKLRKIARDIKDFSHPVLFRLNNEMNSDWTSYSASTCLTDPYVFVQVWKRIYNIFEQEGVDNTIWIFNPNDENFPPNGYNSSLAYYPGNGYVHLFGVTGYNSGTYYAEEHGEKWRTFNEIYSNITKKSIKDYGEFPWIITEFASSSVGGDKVQWINDMFRDLKKFPNIKMAFWFNSADYDEKYGKDVVPSRPYWFDETPETTRAFANGMKQ